MVKYGIPGSASVYIGYEFVQGGGILAWIGTLLVLGGVALLGLPLMWFVFALYFVAGGIAASVLVLFFKCIKLLLLKLGVLPQEVFEKSE